MKLIILVGISGSGKSTWAIKKGLQNPKYTKIVSRDVIREKLFGYTEDNVYKYYERPDFQECEGKVSRETFELISKCLVDINTVIVDNTHLKRRYLKQYTQYDCPKEVIIFDVPPEICLKRMESRVRKVPKEIIEKQSRDFENIRNIDFKELFGEDTTIKRIYLD